MTDRKLKIMLSCFGCGYGMGHGPGLLTVGKYNYETMGLWDLGSMELSDYGAGSGTIWIATTRGKGPSSMRGQTNEYIFLRFIHTISNLTILQMAHVKHRNQVLHPRSAFFCALRCLNPQQQQQPQSSEEDCSL